MHRIIIIIITLFPILIETKFTSNCTVVSHLQSCRLGRHDGCFSRTTDGVSKDYCYCRVDDTYSLWDEYETCKTAGAFEFAWSTLRTSLESWEVINFILLFAILLFLAFLWLFYFRYMQPTLLSRKSGLTTAKRF